MSNGITNYKVPVVVLLRFNIPKSHWKGKKIPNKNINLEDYTNTNDKGQYREMSWKCVSNEKS
jgi:hypothetical protein